MMATARRGVATKARVPAAPAVAKGTGMTVEELLKSTLEGLVDRIRGNADEAVRRLKENFQEEKTAIMDSLSHEKKARQAVKSATKNLQLDIVLEATTGPYAGQTWILKPRQGKAPKKIGRSTGKHFTSQGVSLPDDAEVSTTHGKFEMKDGKVLFTDCESTNGSQLNGKPLEAREATPLNTGDILEVGGGNFHVTVTVVA